MSYLRKYNTLLVAGSTAIRIPIIKRGAVDFAVGADWTPAAGDVKISTDNGAVANITNLPTAVAYGNTALWEFILTAAELSGKSIRVTVADSATKAVEDQAFDVETFGNASAMYPTDLGASILAVNTTQVSGTSQTARDLGGQLDAAISTRATPAQVNTAVATELATTTYAEPGAVPAATSSLKDKIGWLFTQARNKITQTSTTQTLRNDADAATIGTASVSDDGTTFTRGKFT